jgi:hypothetical protein
MRAITNENMIKRRKHASKVRKKTHLPKQNLCNILPIYIYIYRDCAKSVEGSVPPIVNLEQKKLWKATIWNKKMQTHVMWKKIMFHCHSDVVTEMSLKLNITGMGLWIWKNVSDEMMLDRSL